MYRQGPAKAVRRAAPVLGFGFLWLVSPILASDEATQGAAPRWLQLGAELRGRFEGYTGLDYSPGSDDAYYLHRLRFRTVLLPRPWLRFSFQLQDARAGGRRQPAPASAANPFDLYETYVEIGGQNSNRWTLRTGRQGLSFGAERVIGYSDWSNVSRLFDAVRLSYQRPHARVDWFASTLVRPDPRRFDRFRRDTQLHGIYASFIQRGVGARIEPYLLWKKTTGGAGLQQVWTAGARLAGPLPRSFDYEAEIDLQAGGLAGQRLRSWAGTWILGRRLGPAQHSPRVFLEYNLAGGNRRPGGRTQGTFDQLFPTNHSKYGIADRIGRRNLRAARLGLTLKPASLWTLSFDYHSFWLLTRQDHLYSADGAPVIRNPAAGSNHVHQEINAQTAIAVTDPFEISFGYARVFPGRFLRESSPGSPITFAFLMWRLRL